MVESAKKSRATRPHRLTSMIEDDSDSGSDHQSASISPELFSPELLNQLSIATGEEGRHSPSKLDVNSLFSL